MTFTQEPTDQTAQEETEHRILTLITTKVKGASYTKKRGKMTIPSLLSLPSYTITTITILKKEG